MGAKLALCCYLKNSVEEKNAILRLHTTRASRPPEQLTSESSDSEAGEESLFGPQGPRRSREQRQQSWRRSQTETSATEEVPMDSTSFRRGSDQELEAFISMRDQADKDTEEWEKLNYDIHTIRYARREVRSRWKKILMHLGYQCEVESLLCVNRQSRLSREREHGDRAAQLLQQLLDQTSLFPLGSDHPSGYIYVMDRLVSLDSAEDFVRVAQKKYPKKEA